MLKICRMKSLFCFLAVYFSVAMSATFAQFNHHDNDRDDRYSHHENRGHHQEKEEYRRDNHDNCHGRGAAQSIFEVLGLRVKKHWRGVEVELCGEGPKHTSYHGRWRGNTFFIYLDSNRNSSRERDFRFDIDLGDLPRHQRYQVVVIDDITQNQIGELEFD
jgi:hypothetical protein